MKIKLTEKIINGLIEEFKYLKKTHDLENETPNLQNFYSLILMLSFQNSIKGEKR
jgi:hypothetical protein